MREDVLTGVPDRLYLQVATDVLPREETENVAATPSPTRCLFLATGDNPWGTLDLGVRGGVLCPHIARGIVQAPTSWVGLRRVGSPQRVSVWPCPTIGRMVRSPFLIERGDRGQAI
jgi:hypothetical protein